MVVEHIGPLLLHYLDLSPDDKVDADAVADADADADVVVEPSRRPLRRHFY